MVNVLALPRSARQLSADQQTGAAHGAERIVTGRDRIQLVNDQRMALANARQQRRIEMGQHGVSDGCRQRVAAEGGAMGAWLEDLRPGLFRQHRADREAAPSPLALVRMSGTTL